MKQIFLSTIIYLCISASYAQNIFNEHFNYTTGILTQVTSNWTESPAGEYDIQVIRGNLSYKDYVSSDTGNCIFLDAASSTRSGVQRSVGINNNTLYVSFLIMVKDTLDLLPFSFTGASFFDFVSSLQSRGLAYIKKSVNKGMINLGVSKSSNTFTYSLVDYKISDTLLLVMKYKISSGSSNDTVSLWVNPPLTDTEPQPDAVNNLGTDLPDINEIRFRQSANGGNIYVDGIRTSATWGQAPLPVELSSFTAENKNDKILLSWKTETELLNYGFDIERRISSAYKNEEWKVIGFLPGYGSTNSPKFYTFTDNEIYNFCSYSYRLKQINTDGTYKHYEPVELNINVPGKLSLLQNYPNPFNPSTTISFSIPENAQTRLSLYNLTGEKLAELYNKYTLAGDYQIEYKAEGLSSGTYFCVFESGDKRRVIKIVVLK